jgi:methionyl-tRNA synthetase
MVKDETKRASLHQVCSFSLAAFRLLGGLLKPVLPATVAAAERFLAAPIGDFDAACATLHNHTIHAFEPLLSRIDAKLIDAMIEASKESLGSAPEPESKPAKKTSKPMTEATAPNAVPDLIGIDDFAKLDLRVGKVLACEFVEGSDKLLRFQLDAGPLGQRQIFSGIRAAYGEPEKLVGRNVVFIANLAPRKMRFGVSEGMILSAGEGGGDLFLLDADQGAKPGATVR